MALVSVTSCGDTPVTTGRTRGYMHLEKEIQLNGAKCKAWIAIEVSLTTKQRLSQTCFRGPTCRSAGNFFNWNGGQEFFDDPVIMGYFLEDIAVALKECSRKNSVQIGHVHDVGWSSTVSLTPYNLGVLEQFNPSLRSSALRVKLSQPTITAPITNLATIVYSLNRRTQLPLVTIRSIYPGPDVGDLRDDVTVREKCVFFDWDHPGQKLAA